MTKTVKMLAVLMLTVSATAALAQSATVPASAKPAKSEHQTDEQLMFEQMDARIQKLEQLVQTMQQQIQARDKELADTKQAALAAGAAAQAAGKQERIRAESTLETVTKNGTDIAGLQSTVTDMKTNNTAVMESLVNEQIATQPAKDLTSLHFFGVDLKPGGFLAAETVSRQ